MALSDRLDPSIIFRGAGGINPVQNQASQDEKARTAMSLAQSAQDIQFNKILLQQQQIAQQKLQRQQAVNNVIAGAYSTYNKPPGGSPPQAIGTPATAATGHPTATPGSVVGPSGLLIRPGASGPQDTATAAPATAAPQFTQYAASPDGHRIGSNDGNAWFDAETGAPIQADAPAATTLGDASQ